MTDPQPISVAEARERIAVLDARIQSDRDLNVSKAATRPLLLEHQAWQRILATAQAAERRWVTCECGRGPREVVELVDPDSGVPSWLLADRCTECLLPAQPEV